MVGPFQTMLGRFYRGQVQPVFAGGAGWLGEINTDFDRIIRQLARQAAAGDHGLRISPLVNNDRKGGTFPIVLHQFRRAVGVAIVRGNAQHKLSRLHYVRATPQRRPRTPAEPTTATIDGNHTSTDDRFGSHNTPLRKGTGHTNNSGTDTTTVCPRRTGTQCLPLTDVIYKTTSPTRTY